MHLIHSKSPALPLQSEPLSADPIYLITQYFIPKDKIRQKEIQYCLQKNVENNMVETIYLLNERIYSLRELGVDRMTKAQQEKIRQFDIRTRIGFKHIYDFIASEALDGFVVAANSDIMLDTTIGKLHHASCFGIDAPPCMMALLRYEYNDVYVPFETNCNQSQLFGPRGDSQDTWILHSRHNVPAKHRALFDFPFGKPGCDNKVVFLFHVLDYVVYNDPLAIKTYHFHRNPAREYTIKDQLAPVFEWICPHGLTDVKYGHIAVNTDHYSKWNFDDNDAWRTRLTNLLADATAENGTTPFVVPVVDNLMINHNRFDAVFEACPCLFSRDVYNQDAAAYADSEKYTNLRWPQKPRVWESLRNVLPFVYRTPWTHAFRGKRVLVVSPDVEAMQRLQDAPRFEASFWVDTTFVYAQWNPEVETTQMLGRIRKELHDRKEEYDVALVDAGALTNVVAYDVYRVGRSALSMGEDLGLLFGVYREHHLQKWSEVCRGFPKEGWVKAV